MPGTTASRSMRAALAGLLAAAGTWAALQTHQQHGAGAPAPVPVAAPAPQATTPPAGPGSFPTTDCTPAVMAPGSVLGLAVPRPARLAQPGPEREAFLAATACLGKIAGAAPALRTQLPIDVTRRATRGDDERAELLAFGALIAERGVPGLVSVRAHDFTDCPVARLRTELAAGEALQPCDYPSPELYAQLFAELHNAVLAAAGAKADLRFTAWNEPDHPDFTLHALGEQEAARVAGQYWARAAAVAGAERVLAGEFADRRIGTLLRLREAFVDGAGGVQPPAWALHPYRDLTAAREEHVLDRFEQAVAPAEVWLTEVTARLSGRRGLDGQASEQAVRGAGLRERLERTPTRAMLYLLTPPPAPQSELEDGWDSALADRAGRARPFVCGLAALPADACPGNPAAYGE